MRRPAALLLCALPLAAQTPLEPYLPGHDKDLYHAEKARKAGEATVEIRGQLDPETLRQIRLQEFMDGFLPELHRYLGRYGDVPAPEPVATRLTAPPAEAKVYPLGKADF
ncbi:MAG TPA: hypothetical protein VFT46_08415 [Holophagaceae bacterium]|nr:hypothetical protein [Holophagaceae bacterium]